MRYKNQQSLNLKEKENVFQMYVPKYTFSLMYNIQLKITLNTICKLNSVFTWILWSVYCLLYKSKFENYILDVCICKIFQKYIFSIYLWHSHYLRFSYNVFDIELFTNNQSKYNINIPIVLIWFYLSWILL